MDPLRAGTRWWVRIWFAVTAVLAVGALTVQSIMSLSGHPYGPFTTPTGRLLNQVFYFTDEANLLVAATAAVLAVRSTRLPRGFTFLWTASTVGIVITAAVYHVVLAKLFHLTGVAVVTNQLVHTVVPLLAVAGWLLFGPRGVASWRVGLLALLFPIGYLLVTLLRGVVIGWYPYPFLDVSKLGYGRVLVDGLGVAALFVAVTAAVVGTDAVLHRRVGRSAPGRVP